MKKGMLILLLILGTAALILSTFATGNIFGCRYKNIQMDLPGAGE